MRYLKFALITVFVLGLVVFGVFERSFVRAESNNSDQGENHNTSSGMMMNHQSGDDNKESGKDHAGDLNTSDFNNQGGSSFSVNSANKAVIKGASLVSNSGQSLLLKIFGLNLNLTVTASTTVVGVGASATSSIANMKVGDSIDAVGKIDTNSGVITAREIRDRNMQQQNIQSIQQQIQALLDQIKRLREQLHMQSSQ